jgi:VanZ family protein
MKTGVRVTFLIVWIAVILFLTAYPTIPTPRIKSFPVDKVAHIALFLIFGILARPILKPRMYFLLGGVLIVIAEFQQLLIPGRDFEIMDMIAGAVGLAAYYLISLPKRSLKNGLSKT